MKFPESTKLELAGFYQSWFIVNFRPSAFVDGSHRQEKTRFVEGWVVGSF